MDVIYRLKCVNVKVRTCVVASRRYSGANYLVRCLHVREKCSTHLYQHGYFSWYLYLHVHSCFTMLLLYSHLIITSVQPSEQSQA